MYQQYKDDIIDNLQNIKFTLFYQNGNGSDFEECLNNVLEHEPVII